MCYQQFRFFHYPPSPAGEPTDHHWFKTPNTALNPSLCNFILPLLLLRPFILIDLPSAQRWGHAWPNDLSCSNVEGTMDNDREADLKMMYLFGKKGIQKLETPADVISEVRSVSISIFPHLTISEMDFSFPNSQNCSIPLPWWFCCLIIDGQSNGGGVILKRRNHDSCNSIENASAPNFIQTKGISNYSRLSARLLGIVWPTLCFIVIY